MEVSRGAGMAVWRQIQERLEAEIEAGRLSPGERCSTEQGLASRFGVNRHTVRRAVAGLVDKGLVRVEQGRGMFVCERPLEYPVRRRTRFHETVAAQSRIPSGRLLDSGEVAAANPVARALNLGRGAPVVWLSTLGEVDGRPVSLCDHYFPQARFAGLIDAYRKTNSVTLALAQLGIDDYVRKVTKVTARLPRRPEADALRQPLARPVLVTESINVDFEGRPIEFGVARFAGDRVQVVFEP
jgi:GntR family phosphonate transport system transcriptional regulator